MNRHPEFVRAFVTNAKRLFEEYPDLEHKWQISGDEGECSLLVPKCSDQVFDVFFELSAEEVLISCEAFHEHYPVEDQPEEFAANCVGMLYDILSSTMRLRVFLAGGTAYKWILEMNEDGRWQSQGTTSLIFYNYLSRRSEVILQNTSLVARSY